MTFVSLNDELENTPDGQPEKPNLKAAETNLKTYNENAEKNLAEEIEDFYDRDWRKNFLPLYYAFAHAVRSRFSATAARFIGAVGHKYPIRPDLTLSDQKHQNHLMFILKQPDADKPRFNLESSYRF